MSNAVININCGDTLTVAQAPDLYAKFLEVLAEDYPVHVNISNLELIDMTGMQILYAFAKESKGLLDHQITWSDPSAKFNVASGLLGIPDDFF